MLTARFRAGVFLFVAAMVGVVAGDETPLKAIPAEACMLVRFKSPATTIDKFAAFADGLQPGRGRVQPVPVAGDDDVEAEPAWGDFVRSLMGMGGSILEWGDSVDTERDWWMFCFNPLNDTSEFAFVIPATDVDAALALLAKKNEGPDAQAIAYKTWIITGSSAAVDAARHCISGDRQSIEPQITDDALAVFTQGDFGAFVNVHQLGASEVDSDDFGEMLSGNPLEGIWGALPPFHIAESIRHAAKQFSEAILKGINDAEILAISLEIDNDDIRFENYLRVKKNSATAAFLSANPGSEMEAISSLPASSALYLGVQGNSKTMMEWTTQLMKSVSAEKESGLSEAHENILKGYEQLSYGLFALAIPMRPIEQGLFRWLSISEVDHPSRARELAQKWAELPDIEPDDSGEQKQIPDRSTETYGEFAADVTKFPNAISLKVGEADFGKKIESLLCGPDGVTTRTIYLKDRIIECFGGSKVRTAAAIRRVAEFSRSDFIPEPHFVKTREQLGKKANLIVMLDVGALSAVSMQVWNSYLDMMVDAAKAEAEEAPAELPRNDVITDEGVPDEVVPKGGPQDQASPAEKSDEEKPDDVGVQKVDADEEADIVVAGAMVGEIADVSVMKFQTEAIDLIGATRSLIGVSVAFEPQAVRLKLVIPRLAAQHAVKAVDMMVKRFGMEPDMEVMGIEVEVIKEAAEE